MQNFYLSLFITTNIYIYYNENDVNTLFNTFIYTKKKIKIYIIANITLFILMY